MTFIRGIIFDCDGVLFESRGANLAYYNSILSNFNEPPVEDNDSDRAHLCHTAASPQVFKQILGEARMAQALAMAAKLDYRQFIPFMSPEPGMFDALSQLAAFYPLAVATNRGHSMLSILDHFDLCRYFQTVVTSRDVLHPKPAPDMLYEAAKRLQCDPGELLFVGDSELDQAAARQAGMPFAIYRGNFEADIRLNHHQDLVKLLVSDRANAYNDERLPL